MWMYGPTDRWTNGVRNEPTNERADGRTDRRMGGSMDGWADERTPLVESRVVRWTVEQDDG